MKNIKKFHTDSEYYNENEFKNLTEKEKEGVTWKEITEYRDKYTFELPLLFEGKKYTKITQTPWILQKEIKLISLFSTSQAEMLIELSSKYSSATLLADMSLKSFVNEIHWLLNSEIKSNSLVSRSIIENLVNKSDEPKSKEEENIIEVYEKFEKISENLTLPMEIAKMFFKKNISSEKGMQDVNSSLVDIIRSDKINSMLTKIGSLMYAIISNNLFGDKSYEVMVLSVLSLARNSYKSEILKGVSFFKTLDYFKADLYKSIDDVKTSGGDLTYITLKLIDILRYSLNLSSEQIIKFIENEEKFNSLTSKDKNISYKAILAEYPLLSSKQAKFYVNHCDQKINYTLKDFQEFFGSSYETSRYSLEKLVELEFYKKKKIGKKFVYNAIRQK